MQRCCWPFHPPSPRGPAITPYTRTILYRRQLTYNPVRLWTVGGNVQTPHRQHLQPGSNPGLWCCQRCTGPVRQACDSMRRAQPIQQRGPRGGRASGATWRDTARSWSEVRGEGGDWDPSQEESSDDNQSLTNAVSGPSDNASMASDVQEDAQCEDIAMVPVQDLTSILKQGYLEKKRRDHSFFGSEWQRRFCVLNTNIFYYYGSEKDKQQRGAFYVHDAYLVQNLRKDSKKNCCFEVKSQDRKVYQFTALSLREAKEWVEDISFVLKDMNSSFIPVEEEGEEDSEDGGVVEDEEGEFQEGTYDDVDAPAAPQRSLPSAPAAYADDNQDEDIYEELPEDDFPPPIPPDDEEDENGSSGSGTLDYKDYYLGLWDCTGSEADELSFRRGDVIRVLSKDYNSYGWWVGEMEGIVGIVPKDYLMTAYDM